MPTPEVTTNSPDYAPGSTADGFCYVPQLAVVDSSAGCLVSDESHLHGRPGRESHVPSCEVVDCIERSMTIPVARHLYDGMNGLGLWSTGSPSAPASYVTSSC